MTDNWIKKNVNGGVVHYPVGSVPKNCMNFSLFLVSMELSFCWRVDEESGYKAGVEKVTIVPRDRKNVQFL